MDITDPYSSIDSQAPIMLDNLQLQLTREDQVDFFNDAVNSQQIQAAHLTYIKDPAFKYHTSEENLESLQKTRDEHLDQIDRLEERNLEIAQLVSEETISQATRSSVFDTIESLRNEGVYEKNRAKIKTIMTYKTADKITKIKVKYTPDENGENGDREEEIVYSGHSDNNQVITHTLDDNEYLQKVILYHNKNSTPHSIVGVLFRTVGGTQTNDSDGHLITADHHTNNIKNIGQELGKEFCLDTNYKSFDAHYVTNPNKNSKGFAQPSNNDYTINERTGARCELNDQWEPASILNESENRRVHKLLRESRRVDGFGTWLGAMRRYPQYWADQSDGNNYRYSHRQNIYRNWVNRKNSNARRGPEVWFWMNGDRWDYRKWHGGHEPNGTRWGAEWSEPVLNMWKHPGTWNDFWYGHPHYWRRYGNKYALPRPALFSKKIIPVETEIIQVQFNQQITIKNGEMKSEFKTAINTTAIQLFDNLVNQYKQMINDADATQEQMAQEYVDNKAMIEQYKIMIERLDEQIESLQTLIGSARGLNDDQIARMLTDSSQQGFSNIYEDEISDLIYLIQDNSVNIILILLSLILLYKFYCKK